MRTSRDAVQPLSSRLIDRYLMFGLACVFASISLALMLAWRGTLTEQVSIAVAAPLLMLLIGGIILRRAVRIHELIETQLQQLHANAATGNVLRPLIAATPVASGWNKLLQQVNDQQALQSLERRLSDSLESTSVNRWEAIANAISDGIAVTDREGLVIMFNRPLIALLGKEETPNLRDQDLIQWMLPLVNQASGEQLIDSVRRSNQFSLDLLLGEETNNGVCRLSRTPLVTQHFDAGCSLWRLRDVTQQKLADEMRDQFVFTATHELRTPLANIIAYAEALIENDDIDVEQQKGFYNILMSEATRLSRFVDDLLNVSQMETGGISITRHETDVERLISEATAKVRPMMDKCSQQFECKMPAKLPKLQIDKDKAVAALVNLLSNASKYTGEGGNIRLLVELDNEAIHLQVCDSGIGIAEEELPKLGEKFFRSQDSRVRDVTGSGLGLAFVQEVARLHGGRVTISSELNVGSQFTLTLPLG
jgi:signal transduction histidine kinase